MAFNLKEIIAALSSEDETDRCYALENLQQIHDPDIVPRLMSALEDRSVRVREHAISIFKREHGPVAAQAAASLLNSENEILRNAAIEILEGLGKSAIDVLEKYINSFSVDVRKFSIEVVGKILSNSPDSHPLVFDSLTNRLFDEDPNVSGAAAEALGFTKDDSAIPPLLECLSRPHSSYWLQCNIIVALSRIASPKSLEAIKQIDKNQLSEEARDFLKMALKGEPL
ncbi:MAG: HEAT repeat domain-containing protein [Bdellovibrionia bacterium]